MTDIVAVALIAATPGTLAALLSFLNNSIARRNAKHLEEAKTALVNLSHNTNSIKDELLKVTGEAEFARGLKIGVSGMRGPTGDRGPQGEHGKTGERGDAGPRGEAGPKSTRSETSDH